MTIKKLEYTTAELHRVQAIEAINELGENTALSTSGVPYTQIIPSDSFSYSVLAGSPVIEQGVAPNGMVGIKVTASAYCALNITSMAGVQYEGDMFLSLYGSQSLTNLGTVELLAIYGTPAANYRRGRRAIQASPEQQNNSLEQGGTLTYHFNTGNTDTVGTIPTPTSFEMSQLRLQLNPASAGEFSVWLFAVGVGQPRKKRTYMCNV